MSFYAVSKEAIKQKGKCPALTLESDKNLIGGLYLWNLYRMQQISRYHARYLHNIELQKPDYCDQYIIT